MTSVFAKHCGCWLLSMRSGMWWVLNKCFVTTMNNDDTLEGLEQNCVALSRMSTTPYSHGQNKGTHQ